MRLTPLDLLDNLAVLVGKVVSVTSRRLRLGAGATWPGEIALRLRPEIARNLFRGLEQGVMIIAGTNGKTTTALMVKKILNQAGQTVVHNQSGANLLNGVVSAFIDQADWRGRIEADWGVFEIDENTLPLVLKYLTPKAVVLLNLFRDQLDRYGEVDVIAEKWEKALKTLPKTTTVIVNSDDPGVAHLGGQLKASVRYFGLDNKKYFLKVVEHATDSIFCLACGGRLSYEGVYYSHLGIWHCKRCGASRPEPQLTSWPSPLPGLYNLYNTLAAVSVGQAVGIKDNLIKRALTGFKPAFGRQEEFRIDGRLVKLFLAKNPAGFNASLRTVIEQGARNLLLVLNDRIPDGRDVSWIWDVDFELIANQNHESKRIFVSGDRVYDMALRLKYALQTMNYELSTKYLSVEPNLKEAVRGALQSTKKGQTLFILPTYSAMLEVRKILIGRKIL